MIITLLTTLATEDITSIIIGAIAGAIATFIIWVIPTEAFKPRIGIKTYNQPSEKITITDKKDGKKEIQRLSRNIHIVNDSMLFAAYNVTCFVELYDANANIVYREDKTLPVVKANISEHPIVLPFRKLQVDTLEATKATSITLHLVYENRYGTKKTSGPWVIEKYNFTEQTFIPKLKNR